MFEGGWLDPLDKLRGEVRCLPAPTSCAAKALA